MGKVVGFVACERGAITVDWVALVSGILVAGIIAVFAIYNGGVSNLVSNVNSVADGPTFNIAVGSVDGVAD